MLTLPRAALASRASSSSAATSPATHAGTPFSAAVTSSVHEPLPFRLQLRSVPAVVPQRRGNELSALQMCRVHHLPRATFAARAATAHVTLATSVAGTESARMHESVPIRLQV